MAATKSIAMFQRNSNRITLVLIYALSEWILIAFLLLISLFSYLIVKFANYFGLEKPCLWCSRLDHLFEPGNNRSCLQDLVCETHSKEISNLGFCLNHLNLAEFRDMCDDCFCSSWSCNNKYSDNVDIFPWLNQRRNVKTCEKDKLRCCLCCGERLKTEIDPPFYVYEPSWEALDQAQMKNLDVDETIGELLDRERSRNDGEKRKIQMVSDFDGGFGKKEDVSEETSTCSVCELGFKRNDCQEEENAEVLAEEDREFIEIEKSRAFMDEKLEISAHHLEFYIGQEDCRLIPIELTGYLPMQVENNQVEEGEDNCGDVVLDFVRPAAETWHSSGEAIEVIPSHGSGVKLNNTVLAERDLFEEENNRFSEWQRGEDSNHVHQDSNRDTDCDSVEIKDQEEEEDKVFEKLLPMNRKESAAEESFDGSVISDIDSYEGIVSIEKLKSALRADRMALNTLYAELEEERSASAVAANQTMAMINRLQEDKARMQMEALQYQRMMEEQAEYDQQALHILNEIVNKREREKQELEKELEVYRRRVHDFEAREKLRILRWKKEEISMSSSCFSSDGKENDEALMEMNSEIKEKDRIHNNGECKTQNTPVNAVLYLEESVASFEEERISIIEQLKLLEEKIFYLSDEEENGNGFYKNNGRSNCYENGYHHREVNLETNHQDKRIMNTKPKRLLDLFDKTVEGDSEEEEQEMDQIGEGFELFSMNFNINSKNESEEHRKIAIEEEIDHVYERPQALEEDREFLKHCISSLKKGDKGLKILREILQHLRDLRSVNIRVQGLNALS